MDTRIVITLIFVCICTEGINAMSEFENTGEIERTDRAAVATTMSSRLSRAYRRGHDADDQHDEDQSDEDDEMDDAKSLAKGDNWGGYYDFLINEGSYKFWAVFQLATAALLIYSGFAALYYAKVNPSITDDYEDYFLRRRRRRDARTLFFGLDSSTFQRIMDSLERRNYY